MLAAQHENEGHGGGRIVALIEEALRQAGVPDDVAAVAAVAVARRLVQPDVCARLATDVQEELGAAVAAAVERPDLFDEPWGDRTAAQIVVTTIMRLLDPRGDEVAFDPHEAGARLAALTFDGCTFALVRLGPDRYAVRLRARLEDVDEPGRAFEVGRIVPIRNGRVDEAVLQAVLELQEHELRERLSRLGWRSLNPHWGGNARRPLNAKHDAD